MNRVPSIIHPYTKDKQGSNSDLLMLIRHMEYYMANGTVHPHTTDRYKRTIMTELGIKCTDEPFVYDGSITTTSGVDGSVGSISYDDGSINCDAINMSLTVSNDGTLSISHLVINANRVTYGIILSIDYTTYTSSGVEVVGTTYNNSAYTTDINNTTDITLPTYNSNLGTLVNISGYVTDGSRICPVSLSTDNRTEYIVDDTSCIIEVAMGDNTVHTLELSDSVSVPITYSELDIKHTIDPFNYIPDGVVGITGLPVRVAGSVDIVYDGIGLIGKTVEVGFVTMLVNDAFDYVVNNPSTEPRYSTNRAIIINTDTNAACEFYNGTWIRLDDNVLINTFYNSKINNTTKLLPTDAYGSIQKYRLAGDTPYEFVRGIELYYNYSDIARLITLTGDDFGVNVLDDSNNVIFINDAHIADYPRVGVTFTDMSAYVSPTGYSRFLKGKVFMTYYDDAQMGKSMIEEYKL